MSCIIYGLLGFWYTQPMSKLYQVSRLLTKKERENLIQYDHLMSHLLFHRGIRKVEEAHAFLNPNYEEQSHDPFLLKDAEKAAARIIEAIRKGQKIAVYADYDADGIPGAGIWHSFFTKIGYKNFIVYIPHRHDEGFGLNIDAIEQLVAEKVELIITVDCGITDVIPSAKARELGVDLIITDHHEPKEILPIAFAIIDHKQVDCNYPDKNICGSGVAYKLIQAILKIDRLGLPVGYEKWFLDLVGIATLSDMVPLVGENRLFAHYGLMVLRKSPRKGLMQLLRKLKINQRYLNEDDIGYMITPRINAASRMGLPMDAFYLLTADTDVDADKYSEHLDKINNERKGVVASLVKEAKKHLHDRYGSDIPKVIVLGNPDWRPSLLGLVANTCAQEFGRPAFFWGRDGSNIIKGSCRSEGETNVVELMQNSSLQTFIQFGGHKYSGGFAVSNEEIHFLEKRLNEASDKLNIKRKTEENFVDAEIALDEVGGNLFNDINKLAPFGVGNPKPSFIFRNIKPILIKKFGKSNDHVEFVFKKNNEDKVSAISFFGEKEKWMDKVKVGEGVDLVASIEKSMFRGRPEIRLRVIDVTFPK
ncbi:MAG: single-stranded-DNA-specific exonuclease RecJ [Candidatus Levybacteria bacterium]|nr:single-stranded-DNA-specific exonuclease RecJ [Candidatus Levybacteria bacterium]